MVALPGSSQVRSDRAGRKGSGAHDTVDDAHHFYAVHGIAFIDRFEAESRFVGDGEVVAEKGKVDYIGGVRIPNFLLPVSTAFDLKATTNKNYADIAPGHRVPNPKGKGLVTVGKKVPQHQVDFLTKADRAGWLAFWLFQFTALKRYFVLPHRVFVEYYRPPFKIALSVFEEQGIEVFTDPLRGLDHLAAVPKLIALKEADRNVALPPWWAEHFPQLLSPGRTQPLP